MKCPQVNFGAMGEIDVREEIIAPMLKLLGYRSGGVHTIVREQHLTYQHQSLGRRKKSDPELRGIADYICTAGSLVNWVIEAKSPDQQLDTLTEEQAWSYANHPEIRAVYFLLTNGREFKLFQTNRGPEAEPLLIWSYEDMENQWQTISNLLSPETLLRDHPTTHLDTGKPLGPGLRSIARTIGGTFRITSVTPVIPQFVGMISTVSNGSLERNATGELVVSLWGQAPNHTMHELNKAVGHLEMCLTSTDDVLSVNPNQPTIFECEKTTIVPQGAVTLDFRTWSDTIVDKEFRLTAKVRAEGYFSGNLFKGKYLNNVAIYGSGITHSLLIEGVFEIHLI